MRQIELRSSHAMELLKESEWTLKDLADKLCICRGYTDKLMKHLRDRKVKIECRRVGRIKYFWVTAEASLLPAILSVSEKTAIEYALTSSDPHLRAAIFKMAELANIRIHINLQR